jgi:ankyrin repeat protein
LFHDAAMATSAPILEYLLDKHPDGVHKLTKAGRSVLHQAVKSGSLACVETCLKHGADVNYRNPEDNLTALGYAKKSANEPIIKMLTERGAGE